MKHKPTDIDDVKVKRETTRIWMGVGLAVFGCVMILAGICIPPVGVIDGSVLTAVGEVFGLSGASMGIFAYTKRDSAKIDAIYKHIHKEQEIQYETDTEEEIQ